MIHPGIRSHLFPLRPVVLGRQLQPFSIYHWLLLSAIESPFLSDARITFADLQIAVHLCELRPLQAVNAVAPAPSRSAWQRLRFNRSWTQHAATFEDYFQRGMKGPRYFEGDSRPTFSLKTSGPHTLIESLIRNGISREEAWAMAPGMARWHMAIIAESNGFEQQIVTPKDVELAHAAGHLDYDL